MKKVVPIVITGVALCYLVGYALILRLGFQDEVPFSVKLFILLIGLTIVGIIGGLIATLFMRLKEIDKEDKDDLSKY